ncbi:carbohydrate ABC transporter substrate-binding protein, CUT1 family [Friedmanniella luteola]|uniref:Carbohydrate ABC transporter substrate-binding protein, CUT1 family n=1 Tax=Friedmanniella luteola TaxID=546871 RepID=A0A1H1R759_9ACTN|nr:extracellular solute-binding protein [Friedmanniella luteola]SDS31597.1 carbohydrate ABC transporter substrate-binding protein, CUT1 family [Friedmanniella luteola]
MHRRTLALRALAGLAALGLALTACGGGGDAPSTTEAQTKKGPITVWYSNNEQEVAWGKAMVQAWNSAHPEEKVEGQEIPAGKSSEEVIGAAITAGTAPCLVFNTAPSAVGQFQRQGGLVNLATFPDGAGYISERSGATADQYKAADGGFYQMPWKSNPVMIFYNKKLFSKAGLDPEKPALATYDEFLAAAEKIKDSGAADYAIYPAPTSEFFQTQFDFMPLYAAASGGKSLVADGKATFTDQAGIDVATFWRDVYAGGYAGQETYQGDSFADGKAAMAIVGPWAIAVYQDKVEWGSVPVPTKAGIPADQTYTFSDAKNVGLFSACQNQGTAWEVLKFATSAEQDGQLLEKTGQMPLRTDLQAAFPDYFQENPAYLQFGSQAARTVEVPAGPKTVEMLQDFRDQWTKAVITGDGDVTAALQTAADQINALAGER